MIKQNRRFSVKDAGLTQEEAAQLLGTTNVSVGRQERGDDGRGPLTGALEFLIAAWPELSEEQKENVRLRLEELRAGKE